MSSGKNWYMEKLKHPKWQKKRLEILSRDEFTCQECGDTETTLHVHHHEYEYGKDPWDYPDDNLITLCEDCHDHHHTLEDVRDLKEGEANTVLVKDFVDLVREIIGNHDYSSSIGLWEAFYLLEKEVRFENKPPRIVNIRISSEIKYQFKLIDFSVKLYEDGEERFVGYEFSKVIEGSNE